MKRYQCRVCSCFCTVNIDETWEKKPNRCPFSHRNEPNTGLFFEEVRPVDKSKTREPGINEVVAPEVEPFKAGEKYMGFDIHYIPSERFAREAINKIEEDNKCSCCPVVTEAPDGVCYDMPCESCIFSRQRSKDGTVRIEFFKDLLVHNYGGKVSK